MNIAAILILIFILILVNGFFAASEMALVSLNRSKMKSLADNHHKKAKLVLKVTSDSTRYLSTIQVAITLAGFMSSALAGARLSSSFILFLSNLGIDISVSVAVIIITLILSYVTLVLGELVPKKLALSNPNKFALFSVYVVYIVMIITRPFVWLLSISTSFVLKIFGKKIDQGDDSISEEDIRQLIMLGQIQGLYKDQERRMLENIFRFDDVKADMIKTPRTKVYGVDIHMDKDQMLKSIIETKLSRVIVFDVDLDHILGIIHVKDVIPLIIDHPDLDFDIKEIIRDPLYVPMDIKINKLFKNMQNTNHQMALLVDEHGGFEGIVTLEDMLEEIVGEIYDEHDKLPELIKKVDKQTYLVQGDIPIHDLNNYLKLSLDETSKHYHSLSGLYIYLLGHVPQKDEQKAIHHQNVILNINELDETFIKTIELTIKAKK